MVNPATSTLEPAVQERPTGRERAEAAIDQIITAIDDLLAESVALIVAHPDFQAMRSAWAGLHALCTSTEPMRHVVVEMLQASKTELLDDFEEYLDLTGSALFFHLYKSEYDQAGGIPYGSMLLLYEVDYGPRDMLLLRQISMVAAACHCPVIANASPGLFGLKHFGALEQVTDFDVLFQAPHYAKWNQLRSREDTRYLGMALPRVRSDVVPQSQRFPPMFARDRRLRGSERCWIPASLAFGMALAASFDKHGWCVYIRGPVTGGLIEPIAGEEWGTRGYSLQERPVELGFSDRQEQELARHGFVPLTYYREKARLCIFSAPSLQKRLEADQNADHLASSLPYLFLISRIAHYHKSIQRENLGTVQESKELEIELEQWLKTLITRMPDPTLDMRSRFPLRDGTVKVSEDDAAPGFFNVRLMVQPHLQLEGINAQLTLVSKLPRKE